MGRPQKKHSLASIAKEANVSPYVVSCVLNNRPGINEETRAKVAKIIKKNGYARTYRLSKNRTIGLVLPGAWDDWYISAIIRGVMQYSSQTDVNVATIMHGSDDGRKLVLALRKHNCDSAVVVIPSSLIVQIEMLRRATTIPIILADTTLENIGLCDAVKCKLGYVDNNSYQGSYDLTKYLIGLEHKNLAFVTWHICDANVNHTERIRGWRDALLESGMSNSEIDVNIFEKNPWDNIDISDIIGTFSAIVAVDDNMAMACLSYCFKKGIKVPEDISVVGFGNMKSSCLFSPPLTTVDQKTSEIGYMCAKYAAELATGKRDELPHKVINTELVIRESSGPVSK